MHTTFCKVDRAVRLYNTPMAPQQFAVDTTPALDASKASIVSIALWSDIQSAAMKTLAASLKGPTVDAWLRWKRVTGSLKKTECQVITFKIF